MILGCNDRESATLMEQSTEPEKHKFDHKKLEGLLAKGTEELEDINGKDLVLVIGKTGSGKSTFIGFLQGHNFELWEDEETGVDRLIKTTLDDPSMKSPREGSGINACTLLPGIFNTKLSEGICMCDTAGFGDTRGREEDVFTYLAVQMAIKKARRLKAVIAVIENTQLTASRSEAMKQIASIASSLFEGTEFRSSFYLAVNHKEGKLKTKKQLLSLMNKTSKECFDTAKPEDQDIRDIGAVLSILVKTGNVMPFMPWDQENRKEILDIILASPSIPASGLGSTANNKYGGELQEVLIDIAMSGKRWIKSIQNSTTSARGCMDALRIKIDIRDRNLVEIAELESYLVSEDALKRYDPVAYKAAQRLQFELLKKHYSEAIGKISQVLDEERKKLGQLEAITQKVELEGKRQTYNEQTLYKEVKQGVINHTQFSVNTGDIPIAEYREIYLTEECLNGSAPRFANKKVENFRASVDYYTPSHVYGVAVCLTLAEWRHTPEGRAKIAEFRNSVSEITRILDEQRREECKMMEKFHAAELALVNQMCSSKEELLNSINRSKSVIADCEIDINNLKTQIMNHKLVVEDAKHQMISSRDRFRMLETIYGIMNLKLELVDEFSELYREYPDII